MELVSILILDATTSQDGVDQSWMVLVPGIAPPPVDLEKSPAGVVLMQIPAVGLIFASLKTKCAHKKTLFVKSDLNVFLEHFMVLSFKNLGKHHS